MKIWSDRTALLAPLSVRMRSRNYTNQTYTSPAEKRRSELLFRSILNKNAVNRVHPAGHWNRNLSTSDPLANGRRNWTRYKLLSQCIQLCFDLLAFSLSGSRDKCYMSSKALLALALALIGTDIPVVWTADKPLISICKTGE